MSDMSIKQPLGGVLLVKWWRSPILLEVPGLVNVTKKLWKITMFFMGKSTINGHVQ